MQNLGEFSKIQDICYKMGTGIKKFNIKIEDEMTEKVNPKVKSCPPPQKKWADLANGNESILYENTICRSFVDLIIENHEIYKNSLDEHILDKVWKYIYAHREWIHAHLVMEPIDIGQKRRTFGLQKE